MARKRKYSKRRRGSRSRKGGLRASTVYLLFSLSLVALSGVLFFSFIDNSGTLADINRYLVGYFGFFSLLIPINLLLIAGVFSKVKAISRLNIAAGFFLFTICLLALLQSGLVGQELFLQLAMLLGSALAYLVFIVGVLIGIIVLFNLSVPQLLQIIVDVASSGARAVSEKIIPLLKTRRNIDNMKAIKIQGMKDVPQPVPPSPATGVKQPVALKKEGEAVDELVLNKPLELGMWEYPPLSLLSDHHSKAERGDVKKIAATIERTLQSFGIQSKIVEINVGPSVTQYAIEIASGTKLSKITGLANDLALATEAPTGQVRIEAPIPGRSLVGIEVPNRSLELVGLKTILSSQVMQKAKSKLSVPLGLDVSGNPIIADIAKMPHVLIAGTTGSGKSVLINAWVSSLLFRASPSEVKFIMIDPKRVELTGYNNIPHLLVPVVVEAAQSVSALKWALKEMDRRYIKFAESGVKNIDSYNELAGFQALPYIVIFIDELADLMALAPVEVEDSIARLAQMARATGIHLILSTQRPSVDVLTGLIKANVPSRISFSVSSMIDSKVIIDTPGAEKLLGRGDMLYIPPDQAKPTRIQGAFLSEQDVKRLTNFIKSRGVPVEYTTEVVEQQVNIKGRAGIGGQQNVESAGDGKDEFFEQAVRIVCQYDRASSSLLQRKLQVGFNRAARILEQLEEAGVVGPGDGSKPREVLVTDPDTFLANASGPQQ
ncbi:MAG: DNA translocase FtsK [Candidatus Levybacteria bacterium]|nr:DNA translocase FtsK [Candidatus Levybacteria bacterium]MBP9814823.1 DNA translocase FtsK [Candidatus Levybacteria bacterium]